MRDNVLIKKLKEDCEYFLYLMLKNSTRISKNSLPDSNPC